MKAAVNTETCQGKVKILIKRKLKTYIVGSKEDECIQ